MVPGGGSSAPGQAATVTGHVNAVISVASGTSTGSSVEPHTVKPVSLSTVVVGIPAELGEPAVGRLSSIRSTIAYLSPVPVGTAGTAHCTRPRPTSPLAEETQ